MSDWTNTRQAIQSATQKANDAYATARRSDELVRVLTGRVEALLGRIEDIEGELATRPPEPTKTRKRTHVATT